MYIRKRFPLVQEVVASLGILNTAAACCGQIVQYLVVRARM